MAGTLDAFGVGFIVGGVVDVLAISALNQALTGEQRRRENDLEARKILRAVAYAGPRDPAVAEAARALLARSGRQIDPLLARQMTFIISLGYKRAEQVKHPAPKDAAETPDHGDASQAPGNC